MHREKFLAIPEVFCQRDTEIRVKKSEKRLNKLQAEHVVGSVAVLTQEDELDGVRYPAGYEWRVDANTRAKLWEDEKTNEVPEEVLVIKYFFDSIARIQECYWTFDSVDATESTNEAFYGILKTLGYMPYNSKVKKGQLQTALQFAHNNFYPEKFYAKNKGELQAMTQRLLPEIEVFDRIVCQNSESWDQALVCLALHVARVYGKENERAMEGLNRIDKRIAKVGIGVDLDGIDFIVGEWMKPKESRSIPVGTKWADFGPQMDFLTSCFDKWMKDEKMKRYMTVKNYHKRWGIHA